MTYHRQRQAISRAQVARQAKTFFAVMQGRQNRKAGIDECPYAEGSDHAKAWLIGWRMEDDQSI